MISHPSDSDLYDWIDEELQGADLVRVMTHVEDCEQCQAKVRSTRDLVRGLKLLPKDAEFLPDLKENRHLQTRSSAGTGSPRSPVLTAAAAIVIFAIGIGIGAWTERTPQPEAPAAINAGPEQLAEEIQRSGTEYVTAFATLRRKYGLATDGDQGREAAVATLFGAAFELQKLEPKDTDVVNAVRSIETLRNRGPLHRTEDTPGRRP